MFSNVGWGEIIVVLVVGLFIIGPERLPKVIEDVKAAVYAARMGIAKAKIALNDDLGEEFDELRKPLTELAKMRAMGPKAALTKTLFDGDDTYLNAIDPSTWTTEPQQRPATPPPPPENPEAGGTAQSYSDVP
ncbi:MAG: Sec-independent protein translocase protein TatB [Corynebacterium sp.]|nr:Sec-independent protein translocase protein TatB [Corynebacterium sp.]